MKYSLKKAGNKPSVLKGVILSSFISVIVMFVGTALITALISAGTIDGSDFSGFVWIVLFLSALIGSLVGIMSAGEGGIIAAVSGTAVFYLLLAGMNIMLFDGHFSGIGWGSMMVLLGAAAGILVKNVPLAGRQKGKYKYRYR